MSRLAVSLFFVAACAGTQEPHSTSPQGATQAAGDSDEDGPVCHEERPTGSNMSYTVCKPRSERQRDRDQAQDFKARTGRMMQTKQGD